VPVLFGVWPLSGGDLIMHLTVGRWSWEHGRVPLTDSFSYVTEGQPFIAHSWLAELAFYLLERSGGTLAFMGLRFAAIALALWCAARTALALGAKPWALLTITPLVLMIVWGRLEFRPQLLTTALLSLQLWLVITVHLGQQSWRWLWLLPPLYVLWINWHGGWPQGLLMWLAITGAVAAMEYRARWLGSESPSHLRSWQLALLANPYGINLITFPRTMEAGWIRRGVEWQSPWVSHG
jgi:hypothetical protein